MSAIRTAALLPFAACTMLALGTAPVLAQGDAPAPAPGAPAAAAAPAEAASCLGKARVRGELFDEGSAALKPEVLPMLDVVADAMKGPCAGKRILIAGHTEASGDAAVDQSISEKRAAEVKAALVARGVPATRLDTKGFGASHPLTTDPALEELNRRVTFVVEGE